MNKKKTLSVVLIASLLISAVPFEQTNAKATPKLKSKSVTLEVGKTYQNKLSNASSVKWSSKNKKIATVTSKGKIKGISKGKTSVIAKYKKKKYTCAVRIVERSTPTNTPTLVQNKTITEITTPPSVEYGEFSGSPYIEINGNQPFFTEEEKEVTEAFELYSDLDTLGRCGTAFANICKEIMPTEERGEIGQIKPSGWQTIKYPDIISDLYLYNRCHLIGYQLAGENANEKNLITGTRYLNVTGMLPFENQVDDYVERTNNHVLYRVTPIFHESNLVADGVLMEAWSVEDAGEGVRFCVFCYNVQPGIIINYATGESQPESKPTPIITTTPDPAPTPTVKPSPTLTPTPTAKPTPTQTPEPIQVFVSYIGNKNTKIFHRSTCASVKRMNATNKVYFSGRDDAVSSGYTPCSNCKP